MEKYLKIGAVTSPHGVRGEFRVYPTTDDPKRFSGLDEVILSKNGVREIRRIRSVKYSKGMVILGVEGCDTVEGAERFRASDLLVPREKGVPLAQDEYYTADLIGMEVLTEDGNPFGTLTDVIQTGANDVYTVRTDSFGEVLIPAIRSCILRVDVEKGQMVVHLLPGLVNEKQAEKRGKYEEM